MACAMPLEAPEFPTGNAHHCRLPEDLMVAEHLEDTMSNVGEDVLLECRIDGPPGAFILWYQNGRIIRNKPRYFVSSYRNWQRLEIKDVRETDQGVFCVVATNERSQTMTSAILFVPTIRMNEVAYFSVNPYDCTRIVKHLSPVVVNEGGRIELLLMMETYVHIKHFWFKDDVEISPSDRIQITNNNSIANLIIERSTIEDAGIYVLVMTTREGMLASYAGVHVLTNIDMERITLPTVIEHLKRDLDVLENQYAKMLCRGFFDMHTTVQWYMNDILIQDCQLLQHDYGNGYVCLKILDTFPELSGKYRIVLRNQNTGKVDISACNLNILRSNLRVPICTDVVRPLESAVAACGAKVVFHCTFSCKNHQNLRVIWFVGRYKVERSNRMFGVVCKGGTFILHIKKMSIGMAGEVVCEIHQWEQSPKFVHVSQSMANLTMVPPGFLGEGTGDKVSMVFRKNSHIKLRDVGQGPSTSAPLPPISPHQICMTKPIKFKFCKLDEEGNFYLCTKKRDEVKIFYNPPNKNAPRKKKDISVFQWSDKDAPGAWYCVSFQTEDGSFRELGITDTPRLEVQGPPIETLVIFNIAAILPVKAVHRPLVCFRTNTELEMKMPPQRRIRKYEKFVEYYTKREELIGGGAFGKVALVEDDFGDSFAAKYIELMERNKPYYALREFFTLRKLNSNSVVGVVDAYEHPEFIIIVMEYVWGGELFERIVRDKHINEADIAPVVKQICNGLIYIHSQNVVHLDLKPENIVFAHPNSMAVKLIDFGLSRVLHEGSKIKAVYGTREYVAPEVLNVEPVNLNSDMWSLGVVVFMMLSGTMPFDGDTEAEQTAKIISAQYHYEDPAFRTISDVGKDFIDHLLVVHPRRRFKAEDALKHPWIVSGPPKGSTTGALKLARTKLKVYMRIYKAKWQVGNGPMNHLMSVYERWRSLSPSGDPLTRLLAFILILFFGISLVFGQTFLPKQTY